MSAAIDMGAEIDAVLGNLSAIGEAEDLEAATVGEDGSIPTGKFVKAPTPGDELITGPQHQVIGVAENDTRTNLLQVTRCQCFDRPLGADRHEYRRVDLTVSGLQYTATRGTVRVSEGEQNRPDPLLSA